MVFSFYQSFLRWVLSRSRHRVRSPCGWAVPVASAITRWDCPFIPVLLIPVLLKHLSDNPAGPHQTACSSCSSSLTCITRHVGELMSSLSLPLLVFDGLYVYRSHVSECDVCAVGSSVSFMFSSPCAASTRSLLTRNHNHLYTQFPIVSRIKKQPHRTSSSRL